MFSIFDKLNLTPPKLPLLEFLVYGKFIVLLFEFINVNPFPLLFDLFSLSLSNLLWA
jgi:hypothetical protein